MLERRQRAPDAAAASSYLSTLSVDERRDGGVVYTPDALVTFILDLAGYTPDLELDRTTILDPACGAGAFLCEATRRLRDRFTRNGIALRSAAGRRMFLAALERNIFGVDVDPTACTMTRASLAAVATEIVGTEVTPQHFVRNVVQADFLTSAAVDELAGAAEGFSFVVGNPPYVSATRIKDAYKDDLRARFATATGRLDLYMIFMERSVNLLRESGRLAFITPDKFLTSQTGRTLRDFILSKTAIVKLARFASHKVFADAATVPCVSVLARGASRSPIEVLQCERDSGGSSVKVIARSSQRIEDVGGHSWDFVDPSHLALARRLQSGHVPLSARMLRVSAGPATGRDSLFIVPEDVDVEEELLRPIIRGREVGAFKLNSSGTKILMPYVFDDRNGARTIDLEQYPKAKRYLANHEKQLTDRHCVRAWGKAWYEWHDTPAFDIAARTKILVPDLANSCRFAVDEGEFLPLHSVYYLVPKAGVDAFAVAAILNSRVAEFIVRLQSPLMKDGFSRFRQQFLAMVPLPEMTGRMAADLARAARAGDLDRANDLVSAMFKLNRRDENLIERFVRERRGNSVATTTP